MFTNTLFKDFIRKLLYFHWNIISKETSKLNNIKTTYHKNCKLKLKKIKLTSITVVVESSQNKWHMTLSKLKQNDNLNLKIQYLQIETNKKNTNNKDNNADKKIKYNKS